MMMKEFNDKFISFEKEFTTEERNVISAAYQKIVGLKKI